VSLRTAVTVNGGRNEAPMSPEGTAYFVSDAHLGIALRGHEDREQHLVSWLSSIRSHAASLFVVGDLFDFWIEYAHAIRPAYFTVLHHIRTLVDEGVVVHYLAGNHDFALGPFLQETVGIRLYSDHLETTLQGKKIHLHHGDGLIKGEIGYRFLRSVLRNPLNQALYKLLHPDIGVPLAKLFSTSSRRFMNRRCCERKRAEYLERARAYLSQGSDIVVFGHTHWPEIREMDGKLYCNTGEWIRRYTYAKLEGGELSLWEYVPGRPPQRLSPVRDGK